MTTKQEITWKDLSDPGTIELLSNESFTRPVLIFKHSTRCGISRMVLRQFEVRGANQNTEYYFLDLLAHRDISNRVATLFGVEHQSPQVLIVENGKCIRSASHYDILDLPNV